jgi:hypothetical protein
MASFLLAQIYGNIGLRYPQRDSTTHLGKLAMTDLLPRTYSLASCYWAHGSRRFKNRRYFVTTFEPP